MPLRTRVALIWMLLLALPLQSVAAAGALHGMSAWGAAAAMVRMQAAADRTVQMPRMDMPAATTPDAERAPATAAVAQADGPCHGDAPSGPAKAKPTCSVCAACCMAAVLPPAVAGIEALAVPLAPQAAVAARPIGFVTGGPDRPPRPILV